MSEKLRQIELNIYGMGCISCVGLIEKQLKYVRGVEEVHVNFATGKAFVKVEEESTSEEALIQAVSKAGYDAELVTSHQEKTVEGHPSHHMHPMQTMSQALSKCLFSALLTFPLIAQMAYHMSGGDILIPIWLEAALATVVQFGFGATFYRGSYYALKEFAANMDVLIMLGTTAAYGYSMAVLFFEWDKPTYFESSASIITLILFGRWLETLTRERASQAINKLVKLQPLTATIEVEGKLKEVPIESIQEGDICVVKAGENIPVDGVIIEGATTIDASMLTGESLPEEKKVGEKVWGATINLTHVIKVKALKIGSDTVLSSIIRLVEEAISSKAPIQRLADTISSYFVPGIVAVSLVTFLMWAIVTGDVVEGLMNAVAVLVIACPCALGMATPTVIIAASGIAARKGILFKNAAAIENIETITTIVLDKTGTLTQGKPQVASVYPLPGISEEKVMRVAASLESFSTHPLAAAIVYDARDIGIDTSIVVDVQEHGGKGISGRIAGVHSYVGSPLFAKEVGRPLPEEMLGPIEDKGKTVVMVWTDDKILGVISIGDPIRPSSIAAVKALMASGKEVVMLTGDNRRTAEKIAQEVGITHFKSEVFPEHKAEEIRSMVKEGKKVGMVGDGINDAPALATATVGFAIGAGSDIAIETADVILIRNDLMGVVEAIALSKNAMKKVRQNLFFAFIYNALGIPLAAFGLLNPVVAAAAMSLSSLSVITNALLLREK